MSVYYNEAVKVKDYSYVKGNAKDMLPELQSWMREIGYKNSDYDYADRDVAYVFSEEKDEKGFLLADIIYKRKTGKAYLRGGNGKC